MTDLDEGKSLFSPEQEKFLTHKHRDKLLTQFKVGKNQVIAYGSPILMANNSPLIDSMLDQIAMQQSGPASSGIAMQQSGSEKGIPLMEFADVEEKSLQHVFLYLHDLDHGSEQISRLNIKEYINVFELLKYFGVTLLRQHIVDTAGYLGSWIDCFERQINEANRSQLLECKEKIALILNDILKRHQKHALTFYGDIFIKLHELKLDEIIELIDYLIVMTRFVKGNNYYEGIIDRKELKTVGLDEIIKREPYGYTKSEDGKHYVCDDIKHELLLDTPGAVILKDIDPIELPEHAIKEAIQVMTVLRNAR